LKQGFGRLAQTEVISYFEVLQKRMGRSNIANGPFNAPEMTISISE